MDDDLDLDWGNIPDYEQENRENRDFFNTELPREVRLNPNEQDMVVRKSWAEYIKKVTKPTFVAPVIQTKSIVKFGTLKFQVL